MIQSTLAAPARRPAPWAPKLRSVRTAWLGAAAYGASLGPGTPAPAWYERSLRRSAARAALADPHLDLPARAAEDADARC